MLSLQQLSLRRVHGVQKQGKNQWNIHRQRYTEYVTLRSEACVSILDDIDPAELCGITMHISIPMARRGGVCALDRVTLYAVPNPRAIESLIPGLAVDGQLSEGYVAFVKPHDIKYMVERFLQDKAQEAFDHCSSTRFSPDLASKLGSIWLASLYLVVFGLAGAIRPDLTVADGMINILACVNVHKVLRQFMTDHRVDYNKFIVLSQSFRPLVSWRVWLARFAAGEVHINIKISICGRPMPADTDGYIQAILSFMENEDKAMEEALAGQVDRYRTMEEHSEAAKRWMSSAPWSIAAVNPIVQLRYPPRRRQPHIEGLRARAQAKIGALGVIQYSSPPFSLHSAANKFHMMARYHSRSSTLTQGQQGCLYSSFIPGALRPQQNGAGTSLGSVPRSS
ncbi:hypothetical protein A0H81_13917 [Grifola frondosa]|uniref:Uncharacterized protein n=1 Tax=Grifola frondosa TaxID=5627 RepID=A0A1C7LPC3_GRIFR|nr:hypothetical protein A0H81_13917 [Grifola frondosa]